MVPRIIVRQCRQRLGESVHQDVTDLCCLASLCKCSLLEEEMIWDQLAEHTIDSKLRKKLRWMTCRCQRHLKWLLIWSRLLRCH